MSVLSVNGPQVTTVQRSAGSIRLLELFAGASNALFAGFTLRDGYTQVDEGGGGAVQMAAGTVSNCILRNCSTARASGGGFRTEGGGAIVNGGLLVNCVVANNAAADFWGGQGGGVYIAGGVARGCTITNNNTGAGSEGDNGRRGGGVYVAGGVVDRCWIADNDAIYGGGAFAVGGSIRNSILVKSKVGGGIEMTGGAVENSTISDNKAGTRSYSGLRMTGGGVTNTIVYFNQSGYNFVEKTGGSFEFSVSENAIGGSSNLVSDPNFEGSATNNYRLAAGSPCIDSGTNLAWAAAAQDLAGNARAYGVVDRGAYEFTPGALSANFVANPLVGVDSTVVTLTASAAGSNLTSLAYYWNLGNGAMPYGGDKQVVTNTYAAGLYTISVAVTNGAGEGAMTTKANYLRIRTSATVYVATNGLQIAPYTNWVTAATNQAWMYTATDLTGLRGRINRGRVDMGAYEEPTQGTVFFVR